MRMGSIRMLPILCISLFFLVNIAISDDSKYVKINIDAKWPQTPFVLEASEFISNLDEEKFWKFIEYFKDVRIQQNTIGSYNSLMEASRTLLSEIELDMLKFTLSTRSLSPRIQVYRQILSEVEMPQCETVYSYKNNHYCDYDELISQLAKAKVGTQSTTHTFDHIYPRSENNSQTVILYGLVGTESLLDAHKKMVELSKNGDVKYIFRHYAKSPSEGKVHLSGYGVELAIKSTEYKAVDDQKVDGKDGGKLASGHHDDEEEVEGFLFGKLRELHPEFVEPLASFKTHLKDSTQELAPLKVWQLQDLSFQAVQRIMSSSPDQRLKVLRHLSQNIPMLARSLVKTSVKEDLREEIKDNQQKFKESQIEAGEAALFINGLQIQIDSLDAFSLEKLLLREMVAMKEMDQLGLEVEKAGELLTLDVKPQHDSFAVDIRSESVQWLNDLEKDSQYTYWPSNLEEILRPTFPGMLRYIAKNIFHVVFCINPTDFDSIKRFHQAQDLVSNSMPARIGVLFVANGSPDSDGRLDTGVGLVRAFSFIKGEKSPKEAFDFVVEVYRRSEQRPPAPNDVTDLFRKWYGEDDLNDAMSPNTDYDDLRKNSYQLFNKLGLKVMPQVLINGNLLTEEEMNGLEQTLVEKILALTPGIQQATYMGHIHNHPTVYDYVMSQSNVVKRLNPSIQTVAGPYLSMANSDSEHRMEDIENIKLLPSDQLAEVLSKDVKYFLNEEGTVTTWIVADADTVNGRKMIRSALEFILKDSKTTRLALVLCPSKENIERMRFTLNHVLQSIIDTRDKMISAVAKFILNLIDEKNDFNQLAENPDLVIDVASDAKGFNKKKLVELLTEESARKRTINKLSSYRYTMEKSFEYIDEQSFVICNGRIIGPVKESSAFTLDDFDLLQSFESNRCSSRIHRIVEDMNFINMLTDGHDRYRSDMVMKISGILSSKKQSMRTKLNFHGDRHSVLHVEPSRKDSISYDVVAVIDPLTADAQKIVPILMVIINVTNVNLRIFFNCKDKLSEMPLKRFYRYVLSPELTFDANGILSNTAPAVFRNMPQSALLTVIMDTPQSWMVEAKNSPYDLDNIHLDEVDNNVYGDFELEYIVVEGHCQEALSGAPPRGLQFTLGTKSKPEMFDTIVMANLGYFQLKAFPGSFSLKLREGRSSEIYKIDSIEGSDDHADEGHVTVTVDSLEGSFLKAKVSRNPGKDSEDLLSGDDKSKGIWDSITSYVNKDHEDIGKNGTVHIFSVATGRLYERFLRIMMLTVLKHTKNPVKFWFLKNYLSSTFMSFLPYMAKEYNFDYALVQYQWPSWLHRQTDKQRIIWGYKILFLDVLFPLNLNRVIFVDADQVVRTDLKELMEMDLEGAPYAYTPFCSDRTEMDGFRFWNHGYWRSHLAGRPYHISALYVVDLKQFRKMAAGDRLRGQYQGLSQDPNSLANLDQDLPNNMIHQVPIKSLPQEWLWCETWCSDESKKTAKTIDLCNNPQTKEPKLKRATRIVEEWPELDAEIMKLQEKVAKENITDTTVTVEKDETTKKDEL